MSRVRATGLTLVNWKGVFFEHYALDRHVTALEGANGAGKTTVMIAAYLVLLPDLTRLRFTNLGETGATGGDKGIWGRLGDVGRPSYAAIDLLGADDRRLVAGVRVDRGAEPTLHLTPFFVTDLGHEVRLSEIFLVARDTEDEVATWEEVTTRAEERGGKASAFGSAREYFAALFERGVTPLRLASDEERNKMNEMLRTSMTGGISRALTSELRSFLLREESGLSDTLSRMRANLEACRRTRADVVEARNLEREISAVYDAGLGMFVAARRAVHRRAREATIELRVATDRHTSLSDDVMLAEARLTQARAAIGHLEDRRARASARLDEALDLERRTRRASELGKEIATRVTELGEAQARFETATAARDRALAERDALKIEREAARESFRRAAIGLGDTQSGLDELHRTVHEGRTARRTLEEVREALGDPSFVVGAAPAALADVRARIRALDARRAEDDRALATLALRREAFASAMALLVELGITVAPAQAHAAARAEVARGDALDRLARKLGELEVERRRLEHLAERRSRALAGATALGIEEVDAAGVRRARAEAEAALRDVEARLVVARDEVQAAREDAVRARAQVDVELGASGDHDRATELVARLAPFVEAAPTSQRDASALQSTLVERRHAARAAVEAAFVERERLRAAKASLETGGGSIDPDLRRIRDEVDGELVATRFEDLDPAEAATREAELGAASEAIWVDDAEAAALRIAGAPRDRTTVVFVDERANPWHLRRRTNVRGGDLVIRDPDGVRVTRLPERSTLGLRARLERAALLGEEVVRLDAGIEARQDEARRLDGAVRDAEALVVVARSLEGGDVRARLEAARLALARADEDRVAREHGATELATDVARLRARCAACAEITADAADLDADDPVPALGRLAVEIAAALEARVEGERTAATRERLRTSLEALAVPPPSDDEEQALRAADAERRAERDRAFRLEALLSGAIDAGDPSRFEAAERTLAERADLLPALREQHDGARSRLDAAEEAVVRADAACEATSHELTLHDASKVVIEAQVVRLRQEVDGLGEASMVEGGIEPMLEARRLSLAAVLAEERELAAETALIADAAARARREIEQAQSTRIALLARAEPALDARDAFEERARAAGVPAGVALERDDERATESAAWSEARSRLELLAGRLAGVRGAADLATSVERTSRTSEPEPHRYLELWLEVRAWLRGRVPTQIADVAEPLDALGELRHELAALELRLARQENDLRGASEDVARGIEVQLRRARAQVRRLNQTLDGVAFGSIGGIRIKMARVERMDGILTALREGAAQELLFQSNLAIEDALDEIFRRFGGGKTGGQRLLDYREYVDLSVEVRRRTATEWEVANPTRVSTGEAIGVGATLMMVVLTEWERDGSLLRPSRRAGTLRFLFLDEANRLSQDNLAVLFELCRGLDLQLLIAAPEVAHAHGNTTYRLVRRVGDDGREEVIVSGRRALDSSASEQTVAGSSTEVVADDPPTDAAVPSSPPHETTAPADEPADRRVSDTSASSADLDADPL